VVPAFIDRVYYRLSPEISNKIKIIGGKQKYVNGEVIMKPRKPV